MFGKGLTLAQRKRAEKAGKKLAGGILKALTSSKNSGTKTGYKHKYGTIKIKGK